LNNIEKHARATKIALRLHAEATEVKTAIQDDGIGFDPAAPPSYSAKETRMGLANMRERAAAIGGTFEIVSAPARGTSIQVRIPFKNVSDNNQLHP
jgi:signal transduction histidine kinase